MIQAINFWAESFIRLLGMELELSVGKRGRYSLFTVQYIPKQMLTNYTKKNVGERRQYWDERTPFI